jgi:hypothetical protein
MVRDRGYDRDAETRLIPHILPSLGLGLSIITPGADVPTVEQLSENQLVLEHREATIATLTADNMELKHVGAQTTANTPFVAFLLALACFVCPGVFAFSLSLVRAILV